MGCSSRVVGSLNVNEQCSGVQCCVYRQLSSSKHLCILTCCTFQVTSAPPLVHSTNLLAAHAPLGPPTPEKAGPPFCFLSMVCAFLVHECAADAAGICPGAPSAVNVDGVQ